MDLIGKVTDALLEKNWIIAFVSFVISVVVSIFIPNEIYDKLPFESKINVILVFAAVTITVFLILYLIVFLLSKLFGNAKSSVTKQKLAKELHEDSIEEWRCFFDSLSDDDYSILMFFVITENQRPYKEWTTFCGSGHVILHPPYEELFFYKTISYEESPPEECILHKTGEKVMLSSKGDARIYTMKPDFYGLLKAIINEKGSLSHHPRKTYKLRHGNGADLPEFQGEKYQ